jgi:hypothetical protein
MPTEGRAPEIGSGAWQALVGAHPQGQRLDGISLALRKAGTSYALGVSAVMWRICSVPRKKRM